MHNRVAFNPQEGLGFRVGGHLLVKGVQGSFNVRGLGQILGGVCFQRVGERFTALLQDPKP